MRSFILLAGAAAGAAFAPPAFAQGALTRGGQCVQTTITLLGPRLEGAPDSGATVIYANKIVGVAYQGDSDLAAIHRARVGDPVRLCLKSIPRHCPPGDDRGKFYNARDRRTGGHWSLPDSEHMCGGA